MKALVGLTAVCCALPVVGCKTYNQYSAEDFTEEKIEEVVIVNDKTKNQIYLTILKWASSAFNSFKDAVDVSEKDDGLVILKGLFQKTSFLGRYYIRVTVQIDIKDSRARITCKDPVIPYADGNWPLSAQDLEDYKMVANNLIDSFKKAMRAKADLF